MLGVKDREELGDRFRSITLTEFLSTESKDGLRMQSLAMQHCPDLPNRICSIMMSQSDGKHFFGKHSMSPGNHLLDFDDIGLVGSIDAHLDAKTQYPIGFTFKDHSGHILGKLPQDLPPPKDLENKSEIVQIQMEKGQSIIGIDGYYNKKGQIAKLRFDFMQATV